MPQLRACIGTPARGACGKWIPADAGPRCPRCKAEYAQTSARGRRTRGGTWARIVARVKARDGHQCKWPGGCSATTNLEVHHLISVAEGGGDDLSNLITLCHHHHVMATKGSGDRRRRRSKRR